MHVQCEAIMDYQSLTTLATNVVALGVLIYQVVLMRRQIAGTMFIREQTSNPDASSIGLGRFEFLWEQRNPAYGGSLSLPTAAEDMSGN